MLAWGGLFHSSSYIAPALSSAKIRDLVAEDDERAHSLENRIMALMSDDSVTVKTETPRNPLPATQLFESPLFVDRLGRHQPSTSADDITTLSPGEVVDTSISRPMSKTVGAIGDAVRPKEVPSKESSGGTESLDEEFLALIGTRRVGIVDNAKKSYGFIKDQGSDHRLFFHFSEVINSGFPSHVVEEKAECTRKSKRIRAGTEKTTKSEIKDFSESRVVIVSIGDKVSYTVSLDKEAGRFKAIQVLIVQKNAVPEDIAVKSHQRSKTINALKKVAGGETILAGLIEKRGDVVLSDLEMNLGLPLPDAARETGVIVSVRDSYGFIKCAERVHKQVFFHFSELVAPRIDIEPGLDVSFVLSRNLKGKAVAMQIHVLSPGSVKFSLVKEEIYQGLVTSVITQSPEASPDSSARKKSRPSSGAFGQIQVVGSKDRDGTVYRYTETDIQFSRVPLFEGDQVQFKLRLDKRSQLEYASDISIIDMNPFSRYRGLIKSLSSVSGEVQLVSSEEPIPFSMHSILDFTSVKEDPDFRPGAEVEFNLSRYYAGKLAACRITLVKEFGDTGNIGLVVQTPERFFLRTRIFGIEKMYPVTADNIRSGDAVTFECDEYNGVHITGILPKIGLVKDVTIESSSGKPLGLIAVANPSGRSPAFADEIIQFDHLSFSTSDLPLIKTGAKVEILQLRSGLTSRFATEARFISACSRPRSSTSASNSSTS